MNDLAQLPDSLTLWTKDALRFGLGATEYQWNIPDSYYSNDRASTCYVTLVNFTWEFEDRNPVYAIVLKDGAPNYSNTANNGIVLGTIQSNDVQNGLHFPNGAITQAMIKSNPQTIKISIVNAVTGDPITNGAVGEFGGCLTLRFDYINPVSQAAGLEGTFQPNLLKQI